MSLPTRVIAIHATRQCGKDTLCQRLITLNPKCLRFANADALKSHLAPFISQYFGLDVWTVEGREKEIVRPLLIAYGMAQRERDPQYWIKVVIDQIDEAVNGTPDAIPVVTDCRFVNEVIHLRSHYGPAFRLINMIRIGAPPPTEEEQKHYRDVAALADYNLTWGGDTLEGQLAHARAVCDAFGVPIVSAVQQSS